LLPRKKSDAATQGGFTVIETLIVLAIAGLILMIVFEAIPTLERNSRNNQRRQDVQSILASVSRWELNHSGDMPTPAELTAFLAQYGKLTYYLPPTTTNIQISTSLNEADGVVTLPAVTNPDLVKVYNHAKCDATNLGQATNNGASYSDVAGLYAIEASNSGAVSSQCQQL